MKGFLIRTWGLIIPGFARHRPKAPAKADISDWGWDFHTLRGGIDPGDVQFRPQVAGVVDAWKYS